MSPLRRFAPTAPAEPLWEWWPNATGITGWMLLEGVAESRGMRSPSLEPRIVGLGYRFVAIMIGAFTFHKWPAIGGPVAS